MLSVFGFDVLSGFYLCDFRFFFRSTLVRFPFLANYYVIESVRPIVRIRQPRMHASVSFTGENAALFSSVVSVEFLSSSFDDLDQFVLE